MTSGYAVFKSFFGSTVDTYLRQSTEASWCFTHCVKVDLGSRGRFSFCSHCGNMVMRQSTIDFGIISHIFLMKMDSDPVHEFFA